MKQLALIVAFAPLLGAIVAGLFGRRIGRAGAHSVTIFAVLLSFLCSCAIFADVLQGESFNGTVYTWLTSGGTRFEIGFLIDRLSALMMVVVTFVSLMVHVYTIGYMAEDPGYQRFFAYISLFTFSMLMLVMANNFVQLFFGWEAVGLVSYLLIGFWYTRESAIYAGLKAFLVNRVGDFGFVLGIALILASFGTLDYAAVFSQAASQASLMTLICILLFIGAMGKSAQFPLHVWLPDSMEGPTPISALIHAATMVTAGIFMVARMSPLYELSETARSVVLVIGAITALSMALVALTQYDIKRVVAYSTVYTIGYMAEDPGYQRFFAYISLFTFSMLMLVMANNFVQLFFGWEAVGLVSYLLIGFWYTRESAIYAGLKAFLVNRVGDFGFVLGIALILASFGTLDYAAVFSQAPSQASLMTLICILLFIGAMGKSAQFPLHVWLPDSMEGPTPISALIHAATMVTAGIFMVARMSPLYELSETARSVVLVIGAITALSMALVALTQYDIKRVVAYSTLSQLGYMTAALGASAYSAAIFHLMTHAFFKAVLFLAAGSVIIALHHEQDMRRMGGLKRYMPWTYWTLLIGAISSAGIPGFAGFYSKDAIIEAVHASVTPGAAFGYVCVLLTVFVTATYTFRLVFMAFHGQPRFDLAHPPHESPVVVTAPLVLLAVPSVVAGYSVGEAVFGDYFGSSLVQKAEEFHGVWQYTLHGLAAWPFWLAIAGIVTAYVLYMKKKELPKKIAMRLGPLYALVERKYGFDELYAWLFAGGARLLGRGFWKGGDQTVIDGLVVNGSARVVGWFSGVVRLAQTGLINTYAFMMIFGILIGLSWVILRFWRG